ncbi:hypothetical protein KFK09_008431 [Dendrobium nobile]|uniref:Uncharacterized protein n=1 Tax=Dendrobium nobile TaxID=94219 RepID=A0A8T3BK45_DENNO|nr:hypothetical protein KFK09_008431 [Dendrobium nobile]
MVMSCLAREGRIILGTLHRTSYMERHHMFLRVIFFLTSCQSEFRDTIDSNFLDYSWVRIGTTNTSHRNLIDGVWFDQRHSLHGDASAEQHHSLHGDADPSYQDRRITYEEFLGDLDCDTCRLRLKSFKDHKISLFGFHCSDAPPTDYKGSRTGNIFFVKYSY